MNTNVVVVVDKLPADENESPIKVFDAIRLGARHFVSLQSLVETLNALPRLPGMHSWEPRDLIDGFSSMLGEEEENYFLLEDGRRIRADEIAEIERVWIPLWWALSLYHLVGIGYVEMLFRHRSDGYCLYLTECDGKENSVAFEAEIAYLRIKYHPVL